MSETLEPALPDQLDEQEADIAIGGTGFAGPAAPGKEEGLVHMALARRGGRTINREEHFGAKGARCHSRAILEGHAGDA